jgi:hypothetical protein
MESGFSNERCRQLWSAMLLIAVADIRDQEYNSLDYLQSVEFFTATSGAWASWRVEVAEPKSPRARRVIRRRFA